MKGTDFENKRGAIFEDDVAQELDVKAARARRRRSRTSTSGEASDEPVPALRPDFAAARGKQGAGLDPSKTLALAQSLYERSFISYPRTSSQKLPLSLNLPRIITELATNPAYAEIAKR